jgi:hypothetical protein
MRVEDKEKTAFIMPYGILCYMTMPFGLKFTGARYQRCMQDCLHDQIGKNVQVYVGDIVVKTRERATLLEDLCETFANLNRHNIKQNLTKCMFAIPAG